MLSLKIDGDPVRVSICHCLACQRRTGSPFGVQARFRESDVTISGDASEYVRTGDSGGRLHFYFCPSCGSTVYYRFERIGGFVGVPVGAFADPSFPSPAFSVYEARQHHWVLVPESVEHQS